MALEDVHRSAGADGFITIGSVRDHAIKPAAFRRHARRLGWAPEFRGLWVPAGLELEYAQRAHAALSVIDGDAVVTGRSALFLDGVAADGGETIEVLLPASRRIASHTGLCIHRTTAFEAVRYQHRGAVRGASPTRAFADAAQHSSVNELCRDISTALRLRRCTLATLAAELQARKRFPGRAPLRTALGLLSGEVSHSAGEHLARRLLRQSGLQPHGKPLAVESAGRLIAEIDIAFPDVFYGAEIDGPHHLLPNVAAADRNRDRQLQRLGWTIDRFYWFELEQRPAWFVDQVTRPTGGGPSSPHVITPLVGANRAV